MVHRIICPWQKMSLSEQSFTEVRYGACLEKIQPTNEGKKKGVPDKNDICAGNARWFGVAWLRDSNYGG